MHSYEAENGVILNGLNADWWCESVTRGGVATTRRGNNALLHTHVNRESNVSGPLGILRLSLSTQHNLIFSPHKLSRLFMCENYVSILLFIDFQCQTTQHLLIILLLDDKHYQFLRVVKGLGRLRFKKKSLGISETFPPLSSGFLFSNVRANFFTT